jgi:hypothetical protein
LILKPWGACAAPQYWTINSTKLEDWTMNKRLAYLDSFSGLVPCTVLAIEPQPWPNPYGRLHIRVRINADRGAYRKGQETTYSCERVIPRENVIRRRAMSGARIIGGWNWAERLNS